MKLLKLLGKGIKYVLIMPVVIIFTIGLWIYILIKRLQGQKICDTKVRVRECLEDLIAWCDEQKEELERRSGKDAIKEIMQ